MAFRIFQLVLTLLLGVAAALLVAFGVGDIIDASGEADMTAGALLKPLLVVLGGLLVAGLCYYGLWSRSRVKRKLQDIASIPELMRKLIFTLALLCICLLYTSPSPRDRTRSRMPSSA